MNSKRPLVSVIVPVFNAEKFLKRCIDSILSQTFKDFELLLIDDGSKDSSGQICDNYAQIDHRIKVFHKKNGGVSSARNVGIDNAQGEYSIHVDSDDYVECYMLEHLYQVAITEKADMVVCDYFSTMGNKTIRIYQGGFTNNSDFISSILISKLHGSLWNKLIKTSLYKKHSIKFPEHVTIREDMLVIISLLLLDIKVSYLNEAFYHYVYNLNSLTKQSDDRKIQKHINGATEIISLLYNHPYYYRPLVSFKLQIRMDVLVLSKNASYIKGLYPETDKYILKENNLPLWIKISMLSIIWGIGLVARCILILHRLKTK